MGQIERLNDATRDSSKLCRTYQRRKRKHSKLGQQIQEIKG